MKIHYCETWEEAYDICRQKNKPINVVVKEFVIGYFNQGIYKIYPSGCHKFLGYKNHITKEKEV